MFFNGIAYFFACLYSKLNTTEADYGPYGLFSQPQQTMTKLQPHGITPLPRWFMEQTLGGDSTYRRWLCRTYGVREARRVTRIT